MLAAEGAPETAVAHGGCELNGRLGLHLQLTSGRPVTDASHVKSLIDEQGRFKALSEHARPDIEEVAREWDAQVDLFFNVFGFAPNHLDSHHSVHDLPGLGDVYLRLAKRLGVPVRRGRTHADAAHRAQFDVEGPEVVTSAWTGRNLGMEGLKRTIEEGFASGAETLEVVCHPGYSDAGLQTISSLNDARESDMTALRELRASGWYVAQGITLVGYSLFR